MKKELVGRDLKLGRVLAKNDKYTRYYITYYSDSLKISGIMNVPKGKGPFPVLILNHGYINPKIYTNGRGLKREQDFLARRGYVVIHPDYRNHAFSDKDADVDAGFRLGYVEDAINAVLAVKQSNYPFLNKEQIGMLGHSMGGGVVLNVLVTRPELLKAAVLFAPVSADYRDNFSRWLWRRKGNPAVAERILASYGSPESNPEFWDRLSAINYFDRIEAPIMIHHGAADRSVPLAWSERLDQALKKNGKEVSFYRYPGEPHEFTAAWAAVMERTVEFFDRVMKK
ncbi:MAG: alpha/beta fold hydrolase [Candidatus Margulisbacteria bacterium]|nr:alpha/beta fold hydrolase [Candidatus Margulisiibacteriota bacterium]